MKQICLILFSIALISCTNEKKKSQESESKSPQIVLNEKMEKNQNEEKDLEFIVDIKVEKDDYFYLYYSEDIMSQYHKDDLVIKKVIGSENFQKVKFIIPEPIYPIKFRLDVGSNTNQTEMTLNQIVLKYGRNEHVFKGETLVKTFKPNKYMDFDTTTFSVKTKEIDGSYDPFFISINLESVIDSLL